MSAAATLLDRLERVRQTGPGRWIARCPAHQDKSPSLSIRELDDGRLLINCFAGCGPIEVLDALGMTWGDLFPGDRTERSATSTRIPAADLLAIISEETTVAAIVAADLLAKKSITESDWSRLATAASRIARARDHAHGR
jgi:hypothetical protein